MYDGDIASTLVTEDAIREKTAELAARIGAELDARGRSADRLEGQERLL